MTRTSRLLRRLVVVGASTAVIGSGFITLAETAAFAAADNATAVTLSPHGASDTIGNCTPYTATVAPSGGIFDLQLAVSAPAGEIADYGVCDITNTFANASPTTYPNPIDPTTLTWTATSGAHNATNNNTDSDGDVWTGCTDTNSAGTSAEASTCDAQITVPGGQTKVSFGLFLDHYVNSSPFLTSTATLSEGIVAYDDINTNSIFEPAVDTQLDSTSETWSAATAQTLSCTPSSQSAQQGGTAHIGCTSSTAAGTTFTDYFGDRHVRFVVTNGPDKNLTNPCTFTPDFTKVTATNGETGSWDCAVTNGGTAGTDSITLYGDSNNNSVVDSGEPTTTASVLFAAPAPAGSTVTLTCSPNSTDAAPNTCVLPLTNKTATITATVKTGAGAPVSGALVDFSTGATGGNRTGGPDGDETMTAGSCTTGTDGTCTDTLTDASPDDPEPVRVTGSVPLAVGGPATDHADVIWQQPRAFEARFISVTPDTSSQPPTGGQVFVAKVTNRSGDPVAGICVGFKVAGAGSFASPNATNCGSYPEGTPTNQSADFSFATTCFTGGNGTCAVQLNSVSNSTGTSTVTGTILTSDDGPGARSGNFYNYDDNTGENRVAFECSLPAGFTYGAETISRTNYRDLPQSTDSNAPTSARQAQSGLAAGVCSDNGSVTWKTPTPTSHRVVVHLHLTCFSPKRHVVKCVGQLSRPISGVTVVFRNAKGHVVGRDVTNRAGKAVMKLRGLKSHRTHRYHAHAKRSARTFAADSNVAKVRVS